MLYLLFNLGKNRFAIEATRVVEILPLVELIKVPHTAADVPGYFNYRGTLVPVIDLCQLIDGKAAAKRFSTRIILVQFSGVDGQNRTAGLMAEQATTTIKKDPSEFAPPGIAMDNVPCLGPVATDGQGFIQLIDPEKLLIERASELLTFLPEGTSS
jgi:chemotaxis-related protein WspB